MRSFVFWQASKSTFETVTDLTRKKPLVASVGVGADFHSCPIATKTCGSHATACCEPCPKVKFPEPTVTLAANVDIKNGTEAAIAASAKTFDFDLPEPPKRDFTLPLNGEFKDIT